MVKHKLAAVLNAPNALRTIVQGTVTKVGGAAGSLRKVHVRAHGRYSGQTSGPAQARTQSRIECAQSGAPLNATSISIEAGRQETTTKLANEVSVMTTRIYCRFMAETTSDFVAACAQSAGKRGTATAPPLAS